MNAKDWLFVALGLVLVLYLIVFVGGIRAAARKRAVAQGVGQHGEVAPSLLMLAIQVMQQILKDARMREAADQIRTEVGRLMDDLGRLRERVLKLQQHFGQTNEDLRQIVISSDKIEKRAARIEELEFDDKDGASAAVEIVSAPMPRRLEAGE